jgi:hypothetical protein
MADGRHPLDGSDHRHHFYKPVGSGNWRVKITMPFTPFHFGPGLFGKSLFAHTFSWISFVVVQIAIDCETLYYILQKEYPLHRFFHTFLGATLAGLIVGGLLIAVRKLLERLATQFQIQALRPSFQSELSNTGLFVGALIGGVSHPLLDGIMHRDVIPFAPWTTANPLLRVINLEMLHLGCVLLGFVGLVIVATRLHREGKLR